jgi:Tfp pilus assembly protein PilO
VIPFSPALILGLAWAASIAVSGYVAFGLGQDHEIAKQAKQEQVIREVRQAAIEGAADAISKLKVENKTVYQRSDTVVREVPVYRDCKHDPRVLNDINEALTGKPAGGGKLPAADASK